MRDRKIAVIDDDKKFIGEIEKILTMGGYAPIVVSDPLLVVDTVAQLKPDVILLELRMPQKNGFELTDTLNRVFQTSKIPIIAMSAFFRDEFKWLLDFCGIKSWIKKPFHPLDVIWAIENEMDDGHLWKREECLAETGIIAQPEGALIELRSECAT